MFEWFVFLLIWVGLVALLFFFDFLFGIWGYVFLGMLVIFTIFLIVFGVRKFKLLVAPYVPSSRKKLNVMFELADLRKNDVVYDLGAGDGRIVRRAVKLGVKRAVGVEFDLFLCFWGRFLCWLQKNAAQIKRGNFWMQDYRDADVIFIYAMPGAMDDFYKKVWGDLKNGCRVVSNCFGMKGVEAKKKVDGVYLYVK